MNCNVQHVCFSKSNKEGERERDRSLTCNVQYVCFSKSNKEGEPHLVKTAAPFSPRWSSAGCCNSSASRKFCK